MRCIDLLDCPAVLEHNRDLWRDEYLADKTNYTKKFRYRHPEIKAQLKRETHGKCVYCESRIGHNTPGDTDHILPSDDFPEKRFDWDNLTIACTECNRRKGVHHNPFLNPYDDNVEDKLVHYGPLVGWKPGHKDAETTIRILELGNKNRIDLILKKIEKIAEIDNLIERIQGEQNLLLKQLLKKELLKFTEIHSEFSGMAQTIIAANEQD